MSTSVKREGAPLTNIKNITTSGTCFRRLCEIRKLKRQICKRVSDYNFTKYAQEVVTKNQTAKTTTEAIFYNFIVHYGILLKLHND